MRPWIITFHVATQEASFNLFVMVWWCSNSHCAAKGVCCRLICFGVKWPPGEFLESEVWQQTTAI